MGVRGLSTYLRENQRILSKGITRSTESRPINVVVDGWSFLYELDACSDLPWVYGGEYQGLARRAENVLKAWLMMGLRLFFVFDGPTPPSKIPTVISRIVEGRIKPAVLFFRSSSASRSTPHFLNNMRRPQPLILVPCLSVLFAMAESTGAVEVHFADEEADPYIVELAAKVQGYVLASDSDFVIFNAEGYRGYIPMKECIWTTSAVEDAEDEPVDGFQVVRATKSKRVIPSADRFGRGIIPPDCAPDDLSLSFRVYKPAALADHLGLPVTLLPLVGALTGNDFSKPYLDCFFVRGVTASQRFAHVASTLESVISASARSHTAKGNTPSSVPLNALDLIDRTITALIHTPLRLRPDEINLIKEKVGDAALQYTILQHTRAAPSEPWKQGLCALHDADSCPIVPLFPRLCVPEDAQPRDVHRATLSALYLKGYRTGHFSHKLLELLYTSIYFPRLGLEHPDLESAGPSIGRRLRVWGYALLDEAIGLPDNEAGEEEVDGNFEKKANDVPKDDEELLLPLQNALRQVQIAQDSSAKVRQAQSSAMSNLQADKPGRRKTIVEYVRRGSHMAAEKVDVSSLSSLLRTISIHDSGADARPMPLRSEDERVGLLVRILQSDFPNIRKMRGEQLGAVLSLRWVVRVMHMRYIEGGNSRDREKERWTRREANAFLASFEASSEIEPARGQELPSIIDRNVQLTAQILMAIESVVHLSQVLLLSHRVPNPSCLFSGLAFHACLNDARITADSATMLGPIALQGLKDSFAQEKWRRKQNRDGPVTVTTSTAVPRLNKGSSLFGLLGTTYA